MLLAKKYSPYTIPKLPANFMGGINSIYLFCCRWLRPG